jgi:hypothetical protein
LKIIKNPDSVIPKSERMEFVWPLAQMIFSMKKTKYAV